jgi:CubicO group peptidase (beta-lactamase class C family)
MDPAILTDMLAYLRRDFPGFDTLIVIRHGRLVFEAVNARPYEDLRSKTIRKSLSAYLGLLGKPRASFVEKYNDCHNIRSVTKSIVSLLLGIALDHRMIESLDEPVYKLLPVRYDDIDPRKKEISLRQLVTMTSGLASIESSLKMLAGDGDWVRFILSRPMVGKPGEKYLYNSANAHLLSAVISNASQMSTQEFAEKYLFTPLGISDYHWESDRKGISFGGGNLSLSPYDLAKIGHLVLQNGRWEGRSLVSETWLGESLLACHDLGYGFQYGYMWYIKNETDQINRREFITYSAAGAGGQRLFIIPGLDIVIAAVSQTSFTGDRSHLLNNTIGKFILPSCRGGIRH